MIVLGDPVVIDRTAARYRPDQEKNWPQKTLTDFQVIIRKLFLIKYDYFSSEKWYLSTPTYFP